MFVSEIYEIHKMFHKISNLILKYFYLNLINVINSGN